MSSLEQHRLQQPEQVRRRDCGMTQHTHGAPQSAEQDVEHPFDYMLADDAPLPAPTAHLPVIRWLHDGASAATETVVEEVPVALVYNGISQAVMLATPQDLEDFAVGFSLSERIVADRHDIFEIAVAAHASGIEVRMRIAGDAMDGLKRQRRQRTGKTGCGLCGIDSLAQFDADAATACRGGRDDTDDAGNAIGAAHMQIQVAALHAAIAALGTQQPIHAATGAAHAAGWAQPDGSVILVREDVGRHNALDKLIGAMARAGVRPETGFAVVTSRASFEMVQKAARAGIGLLAAVSAPTAMAVRMAHSAGLTLTGFVRGQRHVVYTHAHRLSAC
jgi:formate dehydrogenase accessory protein FdhD